MHHRINVLLVLLTVFGIGLAYTGPVSEPPDRREAAAKPDIPVMADQVNPDPMGSVDGWELTPYNVTNNTGTVYQTYAYQNPTCVDAAGNLYVTWYDTRLSYNRIYVRKWVRATGTWDPEMIASTNPSPTNYVYRSGIAVDSLNNIHVVWYSSTTNYYGIWYNMYNAATSTWGTDTRIYNPGGSYLQYYPSIACRPGGGTIHVAWQQRYASPTYYNAAHMERDPATGIWSTPTIVDTGYTSVANVGLDVDASNNVYVTYAQYLSPGTVNRIWLVKRTAGVWGNPEDISGAISTTSAQNMPDIDVTPNGVAHVVWYGYDAGSYYKIFYRSRASGGTWGAVETVSTNHSNTQYYPGLDVVGDTVCVAWSGLSPSYPSYYQPTYRRKTGSAWGGVETYSGHSTSYAYYPSVRHDRGDDHLTWYDSYSGYNDLWYLRRIPDPNNDLSPVSLDSIWPFQPKNGSALVGATVRNSGLVTQSAGARVILQINGPSAYSYRDTALTTASVNPGMTTPVVFSPNWSIPNVRGAYTVAIITDLTGEQNRLNDTLYSTIDVYPGLYETYTGATFPPQNWTVFNFDAGDAWSRYTAYYNTTPACARIYYDIPNNDWLVTPKLGPIDSSDDSLIFLFRTQSTSYTETLTVKLSFTSPTDTASFTQTVGQFISTANITWRRVAFDLSAYRDSTVYIAFVYKNDNDYGVAIDDVMGPKVYVPAIDVGITDGGITTYPVAAQGVDSGYAWVRNFGTTAAGQFWVYGTLNSVVQESVSVAGLAVGDSVLVQFQFTGDAEGMGNYEVSAVLAGDENPGNNAGTFTDWIFPAGTYGANGFEYWQGFGGFPSLGWVSANNDGGTYVWTWYTGANFHSGQLYVGCGYETPPLRNDDWIISPAITPMAGYADSVGIWYKGGSATYPESLEIWLLSSQNVADTLYRVFATGSIQNVTHTRACASADVADGQTVYVGYRKNSLDALTLYMDDAWWHKVRLAPTAPVLVAPANGATGVTVDGSLVWNQNVNTDAYDVYFGTDNPPTTLYADDIADTTVTFTGLLPTTMYYWYVEAINTAGTAQSAVWSFETEAGGPPPPGGWSEYSQVPITPSGKLVKDGGWIAWDDLTQQYYISKGYKTGDFYSFEPVAKTWTTLEAMPLGVEAKPPYKGSVGTSDGNGTIYATKGNNKSGFWKYTTADSAWTQLADVPLGLSNKKVKGGTDMVYVQDDTLGYVYLLKGYKCEFYRYNVAAATWETLAEAPIGVKAKYDKGSWLAYDAPNRKIYAHKAKYQELYTYSLDSLTWGAMMPGMPLQNNQTTKSKKAKDGSDAVVIGDFVYTLKGGNTIDFYCFDLAAQTWSERETIPSVGSTAKKKRVKGGGSMATDGTNIMALKGNKTAEMWLYNFGTVYAAAPQRSGVMAQKTARAAGFALGPNPLASGFASLRYSLPAAGPAQVAVFDVTGRAVVSQSLALGRTGTVNLDLRSLSAGVYLVKFSSESFSGSQKLVVQR